MSAKKFKFVSPGVFLNEVDQSQLPKLANNVGPVIIGRAQRGPAPASREDGQTSRHSL